MQPPNFLRLWSGINKSNIVFDAPTTLEDTGVLYFTLIITVYIISPTYELVVCFYIIIPKVASPICILYIDRCEDGRVTCFSNICPNRIFVQYKKKQIVDDFYYKIYNI